VVVVGEPVEEEAETNAEHPDVLGDGHALLGLAQAALCPHFGCAEVPAPSRPAEKAVNAAPATTGGTTGSSRAVPSANFSPRLTP
jgi:hypothetical protein